MAASHARFNLRTNGLFCFGLFATTFWLWSFYAWYQGIYNELETIRAERNAAVAVGHSRELEQQTLIEENARMKDEFTEQMILMENEMEDLNSSIQTTGQALGYANFLDGQVPPVNGLSMNDVVVIIKTGATEAYKALPIHLSTTLTHTPNVLLFSDHNQTMGQYQIQDALDEVTPDILENNGDWQLYKDQKQYMAVGQSPEFLELEGGWELDKYKNLHMLSKTYKQRPDAKWYLYIDADSYVLMHNLLRYLSTLDASQKLYLGSATYINDTPFAHGGTGYAISHGAMQHIMQREPDIARQYDQHARENCCGDYVLGRAFKDHGIELSWISPTFQGDPPYMFEMDAERYCQPLVTMHHMRPADIGRVWEFERRLARPGQYILHQDVFEEFVYPYLKDERWDWDCMSGERGEIRELPKDTWKVEGEEEEEEAEEEEEEKQEEEQEQEQEKQENKARLKKNKKKKTKGLSPFERKKRTFEACKKICRDKDDCVMFRIWREECKIDWHLALGYKVPVSRDDNEEYRSGWMMDRVEGMRRARPCKQPEEGWERRQVEGG